MFNCLPVEDTVNNYVKLVTVFLEEQSLRFHNNLDE